MNPTPFFNPFTNRPDLAATALVVAMIATVALVTFACPVRAHADVLVAESAADYPDIPAEEQEGAIADESEAPTRDLAATPLVPDSDIWASHAWASGGYALGEDESLVFAHADAFTTAPTTGPESAGLFFLMPKAVDVYRMQIGEDRGFTDITTYFAVGSDTDSWAAISRVSLESPNPAAIGFCYWPDILVTDDLTGVVYKPVQVHVFYLEGGNVGATVKGWYPLGGGSPFSYMAVANVTVEPDGDSRGYAGVRHHTTADLSTFVELVVFNETSEFGVALNYGMPVG